MYIHNIITFRPCANKEIWSLPSYQLSLLLAEDIEDGSNGKSLFLNTVWRIAVQLSNSHLTVHQSTKANLG